MNRKRRQLMLTALGAAAVLATAGVARAAAKPRVIKIVAKKFVYTPSTIHVKAGESVVLEFTALDFVHGFSLPDLGLRADLPPGQVTRVPLKVDKAGKYAFLCDNFCGDGHEGMNGAIVAS